MRRIITFDSYDTTAYDILDALDPYRSMPGIRSLEVLTAVEGSPRYCIILDVDDDKDAALAAMVDSARAQYTGAHSNFAMRAYRKVG